MAAPGGKYVDPLEYRFWGGPWLCRFLATRRTLSGFGTGPLSVKLTPLTLREWDCEDGDGV